MSDQYATLQTLSWRRILLPVGQGRTVTFSHSGTEHTVQYGRGQIVDLTGAENLRFRYPVPMREDIAKGPYANLFTAVLPALIEAMRDPSPGPLVDPVLGEFTARPLSFAIESDVFRRDGDDMTLEFIQDRTLDDVEAQDTFSVESIVAESREVDRAIALIPWEQTVPEQITSEEVEWTQVAPPPPTINPIDAVAGVFRQGELATKRTKAIFADTALRLRNLEDAIDAQGDASNEPLRLSVRRLRLRTMKAQRRLTTRGRLLSVTRLPNDMTTLDAARLVGLTIEQFTQLNPRLAKSPDVSGGTLVTHYRA